MLRMSFNKILSNPIHEMKQPTTIGVLDVTPRLFSSEIIPSATSSAPPLKRYVPGHFHHGVMLPGKEQEAEPGPSYLDLSVTLPCDGYKEELEPSHF